MNNLISIITPVKNVSKWIGETYLSIKNQTHTNWEWIIIDDHSTDDTYLILQELQLQDARLKIQHANQKGIIPALQQAFDLTTGDFITRMDGDDLMPETRLATMLERYLKSDNDGIVTGKVRYFSKEKVSDGYLKYEKWLNQLVDDQSHYAHIYRECVVASPNWMMKRSTAKEILLFEQLQYPEDYNMCFQWLQADLPILTVKEPTLLWREHPQRTSRNSDVYQQESFFRLKLNWFQKLHPDQSIGILGYGTKGKLAAKILNELNREVEVYVHDTQTLVDDELRKFKKADALNTDLLLISIFPPNLTLIEKQLEESGYVIGKNAYYL